jgi:hypothetical protein
MARPSPALPSPPPDPDAPAACAADSDGDDALEGAKALHTSAAELRTDGEAALARACVLGATELANTDCPPLWATPAVAPRTRAANCEAADGGT